MVVHLLGRARYTISQHVELRAVAHAGELLQRLLGLERQAVQLPDHEVDHVVGVSPWRECDAGPTTNRPSPMIEGEQALVGQRQK